MAARKKKAPESPYVKGLSAQGKASVERGVEHVQVAQNEYDGSADGFFKLGQLLIECQIRLRRIEEHLGIEIDPPEPPDA